VGLFSRRKPAQAVAGQPTDQVLILTPMKNAAYVLPQYWYLLYTVNYPRHLISLGFLESDSDDGTYEAVRSKMPVLQRDFRQALLWKRDFNYRIPEGTHRHEDHIQAERRSILARSRNHLLFHALDNEKWVLWVDVDLQEYPPDIIQRLIATGKDIVHPHCICEYGGPTYDQNAWVEAGLFMDQLREHDMVRLASVGGTMLLIRADLHRDGLIFPPYFYGQSHPDVRPGRKGEIETEGLGLMATDMGAEIWGLPNLEIRHLPF
jgi:hypothetical protein